MKNLKFTLIVTLVIILSVVFPISSFATDANPEAATTSEVVEPTADNTGEEEPVVDNTASETTEGEENPEDTATDGTTEEGTSDENATEDENTEENTTIDATGNYFESNTDINFTKNVDGNVFLFGDNITIDGKINGDLFVIGDNVTQTKDGQVYGNVFLIADNFTQSGLIYNLLAFTTNYTCEYDGMAALDLKVFADNIKFSGYTERSTYFYADKIELTDDAFILGNLVYNENADLTIGENTTIYGQKVADNLFSMLTSVDTSNLVISHIISVAVLLGTILFILLMIIIFKPNTFSRDVRFKFSTALKALGVGILSFIALTVISTILLLSTIFTTAGFIVLMLFILACILGLPVTILTLATILYNKFNKNKSKIFVLLYTILLTLVYYALSLIPYAGFIITLIVSVTGLGLITLWLFNLRKNNKVNKTIENSTSEKKTLSENTVKKDTVKEDKKNESKKDSNKKGTDKKDHISKDDNKKD